MTAECHPDPSPSEFAAVVRAGLRDGALVTVHAECSVEYEGRTGGSIGPGDRLVVCKRDGTLLVHRPTGHDPVNWQPAGGSVRVTLDDGRATLRARRSDPNEYLRVYCHEVHAVTRCDATDGATYRASGTEAEMHEQIRREPGLLEDGLRVVEHERETPYGFVDFYAEDARGTPVVIEVKRREATLAHFDQLRRYAELYREDNPEVRGMLVAPSASDRVKRALRDAGLEFVRLAEFGGGSRHTSETTLSDFG